MVIVTTNLGKYLYKRKLNEKELSEEKETKVSTETGSVEMKQKAANEEKIVEKQNSNETKNKTSDDKQGESDNDSDLPITHEDNTPQIQNKVKKDPIKNESKSTESVMSTPVKGEESTSSTKQAPSLSLNQPTATSHESNEAIQKTPKKTKSNQSQPTTTSHESNQAIYKTPKKTKSHQSEDANSPDTIASQSTIFADDSMVGGTFMSPEGRRSRRIAAVHKK